MTTGSLNICYLLEQALSQTEDWESDTRAVILLLKVSIWINMELKKIPASIFWRVQLLKACFK